MNKTIWTIGHSTHSGIDFLKLLIENNIRLLADVRRFPSSNKFPHFNQQNLIEELSISNIDYIHFETLGGRRKTLKNSIHTEWKNNSFRGYADYMDTPEFKTAIHQLEEIASKKNTAYMCSELLWWRCHRSMISDYLKQKGWKVLHILSENKIQEHPYTSAFRQGNLFIEAKS